jgi:hypothetical protein
MNRSPRLRLEHTTPAVLRLVNGHRNQAELQAISLTGGLLGLSRPLNRGSQVKVMFVTEAGAVLGAAEMLKPVSWDQQPFRFLSLDENSRRRLNAMIQPGAKPQHDTDDWIAKYRSAVAAGNRPRKRLLRTVVAALMVAAVCVGAAIFMHGVHLR